VATLCTDLLERLEWRVESPTFGRLFLLQLHDWLALCQWCWIFNWRLAEGQRIEISAARLVFVPPANPSRRLFLGGNKMAKNQNGRGLVRHTVQPFLNPSTMPHCTKFQTCTDWSFCHLAAPQTLRCSQLAPRSSLQQQEAQLNSGTSRIQFHFHTTPTNTRTYLYLVH